MVYYSERNELRQPIAKTYEITIDHYQRLFKVCQNYFQNLLISRNLRQSGVYYISYLPQDELDDLIDDLKYDIPDLFDVRHRILTIPAPNIDYSQTALLDFVEFVAQNCKTYNENAIPFSDKTKIEFVDSDRTFKDFQYEINNVFQRTRLSYCLNKDKQVERVIEKSPLTPEVEKTLLSVKEPGLHKLLEEAIQYHRSHREGDAKVAVDKIWDAFERLKSYYCKEMGGNPQNNKKNSADKVIANIVEKVPPEFKKTFIDEFNTEFKTLTEIGNKYLIRHSETNQTDISDPRHYDYFFNRCVSLIVLAVQYLK